MKRFVKYYYYCYGEVSTEDQINNYAEQNNLEIISISPLYPTGMYVLFEEHEKSDKKKGDKV